MQAQMSATSTTAITTAWRTPNALVRKVPEATMTLLFLIAGSWIRTLVEAEGDYNKRPPASGSLPSASQVARGQGRERSCLLRAATPPPWRNERGIAGRRPAGRPPD